jgi:hypothetical protein
MFLQVFLERRKQLMEYVGTACVVLAVRVGVEKIEERRERRREGRK